ncbi:SdrD B-like domain-containing protein [Aquihabitans sp. G128]|uniref:SdrD B-like domain-containing protein n=1 Tax=Aquihabitans sp. G128 TaxID=2849779 RepID=UPI0020B262FF|nr:SdrD B-like domain-containing protein [Aquihabitans sp. G128]
MAQRCAPGRIHGLVRNAVTKEPIEGASVSTGIGKPSVTGVDGRFLITEQKFPFDKPGAVTVTAFKSGFISSSKNVTIYCGADIEVNFGAATPTTSITGTVTKASDGSPVAGAFVGSGFGGTATTDSQGRYALADAPLGEGGADKEWLVSVIAPTAAKLGSAEKTATVRSAGPTTLDFQLAGQTSAAPPDAVDDRFDVSATDVTRVAPASGVLANDTGTGLTVAKVSSPAKGTLALDPDGGFSYTPTGDFVGDVTFTYRATATGGLTDVATVTLHVVGPDAPTAADDTGTTPFETALVVGAPGVLANDTGAGRKVTANSQPGHGSATVAADGSYTYTPVDGFSGADSFTYTLTDPFGRTKTATVRITVGAAPPVVRYALGDRAFRDLDGDGIQDAGEPGASGVAVQLLGAGGGVLASTTTNAQGTYAFDDLAAGDYGVRFTAPVGFAFSAARQGTNRAVDSDPDGSGAVATFRLEQGPDVRLEAVGTDPLISKATLVDRTIDAGLVALPGGVAITATARPAGSTGPSTALAQAPWGTAFEVHVAVVNNGDAPLGSVAVSSSLLAGCARTVGSLAVGATESYDCTGPFTPTRDAEAALHVEGSTPGGDPASSAPVEADSTVRFQLTYSIGDRVWEDLDHDGSQDAGEPGIEGVAVALLDGGGATIRTTATDSDGRYRFDAVRPGSTRVEFRRTGAYRWTSADVGNDALDSDAAASSPSATTATSGPIAIADGQAPAASGNPATLTDPSIDAGLWRPASLAGTAYADADHDGRRGSGEAAIPDVAVDLLDVGGAVVGSTKTGSGGTYAFTDLVPGSYRIRWTLPAGYQDPNGVASKAADGTGTSGSVVVASGQAVTGVDIALWPTVVVPTTTTTTTTTMPTTTTTTVPSSTTTSTLPTSTSTTTTTTTVPSSTTTTGPTTPSSTSTSTTLVGSTSTTAAGPTTSTGPAAVSPADTTPSGGASAPTASPLPRTGSDPGPLVATGLVALAIGCVVLLTRRRLRRTS